MIVRPFKKQREFIHKALDPEHRFIAGFAGKRGGKSRVGALVSNIMTEEQRGLDPSQIEPYQGAIIAPSFPMLSRLSIRTFNLFSRYFEHRYVQSPNPVYTWHNNSIVYGLSGENPAAIEGLKLNWIWIDECWQVSEQLWLEAQARISDTKGKIFLTGSLGVQFTNPKTHWAYRDFIEKPIDQSAVVEWSTSDNPHFPKDELQRLKRNLDPKTYRQMFEIDYNVVNKNAVFDEFDEGNVLESYTYDPQLETWVSIDWGWSHPMAVGFFQIQKDGSVVQFDEIIESKMKLETLWQKITSKKYRINKWCCDIAGNQEREQTGISNMKFFKDNYNINFTYSRSVITYGVSIVRSWVQNGLGQKRFKIFKKNCPKSIDGMVNYSYQEKNGMIANENPVKKDDDACDMIRYFFVNRFDPRKEGGLFHNIERIDL
jgi:PBSX family phage terminase large subunit